MSESKIEVSFIRAELNSFIAERDFPKLHSQWVSPGLLKFINRLIQHFFYTESTINEVSYKRHAVNKDNVMRSIVDQDHMIQMIYGNRSRGILIGPKQMDMLERECPPYSFDIKVDLRGPQGRRIRDLNVEIVPWLDGVILLPSND